MLRIKVNAEYGRGLYATRSIEVGEIVETCELLVLSVEDTIKVNETDLKWYTFVFNPELKQDCLVLGNGELFNHSDTPNVKYELSRSRTNDRFIMVFTATRYIAAGEQLFTDYTQDTAVDAKEYFNKNLI